MHPRAGSRRGGLCLGQALFLVIFLANSEDINGLCITEVKGFMRRSMLGYTALGERGIGM